MNRIDQLELGASVVDNSWFWEHRSGFSYSGSGLTKPVRWLVAGQNHYDISDPHVTLVSEELVFYFAFDRANETGDHGVSQYWVAGAHSCSLRDFIRDVFEKTFTPAFAAKLLSTRRKFGNTVADDFVYILSADELGGNEHDQLKTSRIGRVLPYFEHKSIDVVKKRRAAIFETTIMPENSQHQHSRHIWDVVEIADNSDTSSVEEVYWTCSPVAFRDGYLYIVFPDGRIEYVPGNDAETTIYAVRVAINIKADTLVSVKPNSNGCYEIDGLSAAVEKINFVEDMVEINSGESISLAIVAEPVYATDKRVKYTSSNVTVANVNAEGILTAVAAGEAVITAEALGGIDAAASCSVKVVMADDQMQLGDLAIGARVADKSWLWEFRKGPDYSGKGKQRAVVWIVVAKDHYEVEGGASSVTLMAEELIANHCFDDSKFRGDFLTSWLDSGQPDGRMGLRPFLNGELKLPEQLNLHISVAGTKFGQCSANIKRLSENAQIKLQREPENKYDHYAIAVLDSGSNKLGYVPQEMAGFLAPLLDSGKDVRVEIARIGSNEQSGPSGQHAQLELFITIVYDSQSLDYVESRTDNRGSFYGAFSANFRKQVLDTCVPNVDINSGEHFITRDKVFIPSHTEVNGEKGPLYNYNITDYQGYKLTVGSLLPYFDDMSQHDLCFKRLPADMEGFYYYWTRSACRSNYSHYKGHSNYLDNGELLAVHVYSFSEGFIASVNASNNMVGVRPMVNLKADTPVCSEQRSGGVYYLKAD